MDSEKRAYSIDEFCQRYGLGRTSAYGEIKAGRLTMVKAGRRSLIPSDAAEEWFGGLQAPAASDKPSVS